MCGILRIANQIAIGDATNKVASAPITINRHTMSPASITHD